MLIDQIKKANIQAMKDRDVVARGAYSILISRYQEALTSGSGKEIGDADIVRMIQKFAKELEEEKSGYEKAGRLEDASATLHQLEVISAFLPKMLEESEIKTIILGLEDKSIPAVMKYFKTNYDGKVDMGLVSKIARSL